MQLYIWKVNVLPYKNETLFINTNCNEDFLKDNSNQLYIILQLPKATKKHDFLYLKAVKILLLISEIKF